MSSSTPKSRNDTNRTLLVLAGLLAAVTTFVAVMLLYPRGEDVEGAMPGPPTEVDDRGPVAVAHLEALHGSVQWRQGQEGAWSAASETQPLQADDGVRTGEGGEVVVVFVGGGWLKLQPHTELDLADVAGTYALALGRGEIELSAEKPGGMGFQLMLGDAKEFVVTEGGRARLAKTEGGLQIQMVIGNATVDEHGEQTRIAAGTSFLLHIGKAKVIGRETVATFLRDPVRGTRVRAPGERRSRRLARKSVEVAPGTDLRVGSKKARLVDPSGGELTLQPRSAAVFGGTYRSSKGRDAHLDLKSGEVRIRIRRDSISGSRQEVATPHASVVAAAEGSHAEARVSSRKSGSRIEVHLGRADVSAGDRTVPVRAGQALTVDPEGKIGDAVGLPSPEITAVEGEQTRIFYDRPVGSVGFGWKTPAKGETMFLELSRHADFRKNLFREPVEGKQFAYHGVSTGRTYWRIWRRSRDAREERAGPVGEIELLRDPAWRKVASQNPTNIVEDTGIQTTILFQGKVPSVTFAWEPVEGSESYRVRVYTGDHLDQPWIDSRTSQAKLTLPAGKLHEGTYFWYQTATSAAGEELHTSEMNKLVLVFDNATHLLRIDSPGTGERPGKGAIRIRGLAARGATLTAAGQPVPLDASGRFDQDVPDPGGRSLLVFRLEKEGLGDVYFVRHLGR